MARAKREDDWNHTASELFLQVQINSKKGKTHSFENFHPYAKKKNRLRKLSREESRARMNEAFRELSRGHQRKSIKGRSRRHRGRPELDEGGEGSSSTAEPS